MVKLSYKDILLKKTLNKHFSTKESEYLPSINAIPNQSTKIHKIKPTLKIVALDPSVNQSENTTQKGNYRMLDLLKKKKGN